MTIEVKDRRSYDDDFYAWSREQAKQLSAQVRLRKSEPIDWQLLAEEVEELGNEQRRAVASDLERLIRPLLKLEFAKDQIPRRQWLLSVDSARDIAPTLGKAHV